MADIVTEDVLKAKFEEILTDYGFQSEVLDVLSKILATGIQLNTANSLGVLFESSIQTAKNLESFINWAANNFYSVPRGTCQTITLLGLNVPKPVTISKYSSAISASGNHKLYYTTFRSFTQDSSLDRDFELVLKVASGDVVINKLVGDGYLLKIADTGISEDIAFYKGLEETADNEIVCYDTLPSELRLSYAGRMYTSHIRNLDTILCPYFIQTIQGYGVQIWNCNKFSKSDNYIFHYLKLVDSSLGNLSIQNIRSLPGFLLGKSTVPRPPDAKPTDKYSFSEDQKEPMVVKSEIVINTILEHRSNNIMTTYSDIHDKVYSYFPEFLGFYIDLGEQSAGSQSPITVYYLMENNAVVDTEKIKEFSDFLKAYNITQPIVFTQAKAYNLNEDGTGTEKTIAFQVTVYYSGVIDESEVSGIVDSFSRKIGGTYLIDAVTSEICKIPVVRYCTIGWESLGGKVTPADAKVVLKPYQYIKFGIPDIKYESIYSGFEGDSNGIVQSN